MRGLVAALATAAVVVACCAALPLVLAVAAFGGVTVAALFGSVGPAVVAAALLTLLAIALRRRSYGTPLREDATRLPHPTTTPMIGHAHED